MTETHTTCLCDCGGTPKSKRSRFMPGHDAQLKARLFRTIRDSSATDEERMTAIQTLDRLGWPHPVAKRTSKRTTTSGNGDAPEASDVESLETETATEPPVAEPAEAAEPVEEPAAAGGMKVF